MENSNGKGPFAFDQGDNDTRDMWNNVPWIAVHPDGLESLDDEHIHHHVDCVGMDDFSGYLADLYGEKPLDGQWSVGCTSREQFLHWFPKQSLADFERHGMKLDIYDVPESATKRGQWQVMFDPTKATLVKSEPLTALVKGNA
jgi:hypothetical protein